MDIECIKNLLIYLLLMSVITAACSDNVQEDPLPPAVFDEIIIDLNLPQYQGLSVDGGNTNVTGGLRDIIVYRENALTYHAIERNCTYLPFEAGSTVSVDPNNPILLRDPSCGSVFNLPDVFPSQGPAVVPLRKYRTVLDGRTLTIINEQIN